MHRSYNYYDVLKFGTILWKR